MPNPERDKFNDFFRFLLHKCGDCFQRDVLRDNKEAMWASWEKYAKEWEEQEVRRVQGSDTPPPGGGE